MTLGREAKKNYQLFSRRVLVRIAPVSRNKWEGKLIDLCYKKERLLLMLGRAKQVLPSLHVLGSPQKPTGRTRGELRGAPSHRCDSLLEQVATACLRNVDSLHGRLLFILLLTVLDVWAHMCTSVDTEAASGFILRNTIHLL